MTLSSRLAVRFANHAYRLTAPGQTVATLWNLEAPPLWVRLLYFNHSFARHAADAAAIATSTTLHDGANPTGPDGAVDAGRWRPVSFASEGADSDPLLPPAPARRDLALPPNRNRHPGRPLVLCSDWVRTDPVARSDGGAGALLLVRSYAAAPFPCSLWDPRSGLAAPVARTLRSFVYDSDLASAPGLAPPVPQGPLIAPHAVEYVTAARGATVIGIGDSIQSSLSTSGRLSGAGPRACALVSTPARPVSWLNEAYAGRSSEHFHFNGVAAIRLHRPQIALIQCWSGNDQPTLDAAEAAFARGLLVAEEVQRHGGTPVLLTAAPSALGRPEIEPFRAASNEWVRAAGQRGFHVLDLDARWGTGGTPNTYRQGYNIDGVHPNDRACADLAKLDLAPLLLRILEEAGS